MDITIEKDLQDFFSYSYDSKWNTSILNGNFLNIKNDVIDYINRAVTIPVDAYIEYIQSNTKRLPIMASDVFQFSKFDDATINLCYGIQAINNPGVKFKDVANLLFNDNIQRKDNALSKYGENHIKAAELLGLAFRDSSKTYYLSAIGCVFPDLDDQCREKILVRLIIRNKLITQLLITALKGEFDLETFLYDLSASTYIRRRTNINQVLEVLNNSEEFDFLKITKNIIS